MSNEENQPNSTAEAPAESPSTAEALMSRILEPRVKTNAKNNFRSGKIAAPEIQTTEIQTVENLASDTGLLRVNEKIGDIAGSIAQIDKSLAALQKQAGTRDQAFDLIYEELSGYKNDFYYERLKPTLRSLLFLLDSIEQFDQEIDTYEHNGEVVSHETVKSNLLHFRDQLTDTFALSELAPLENEGEAFNPKTQRAVQVVKVEADQNNTVQRQIRSGWTLGGKILRPADVVVGKNDAK